MRQWQFTAETSPTFATSTSSPSASRHRGPRRRGFIPESAFFTLRGHVAASAPILLGRLRHLEYWQLLGALTTVFAAALGVAWVGATLGVQRPSAASVRRPRRAWFFWALTAS